MDKLDMESVDIVDENIKKIGNLFPDVVVESENGKAIDFDLLKQELSKDIVEGNKEKYQLTWPGKKEAILTANTPTKNTLRPLREKSVDFDNTQNIYIEGDNLEALKILQESYLNKIKCIYIDPPYNTGNDFIYNDNFNKDANSELEESGQIDENNNRLVTNTESNGRFHSDWLSMMYSRLKLARNLLSDDGIIFISIDDNEQCNLKKICDEIYGEHNFYGEFIQLKGNTQNDSKSVQKNHEYILCYTKKYQETLLTYNSEVQKEVFEDSYYLGRDTGASSGHDKLIERKNLGYTIYYVECNMNEANEIIKKANEYGYNYYRKDNKIVSAIALNDYNLEKITENAKESEVYTDNDDLLKLNYIPIRPPKRKGDKLGCWTWSIDKFKEYWNKNEVLIKNNRNVIKKEFINIKDTIVKNNKRYYINSNKIPLKSIIDISNAKGSSILKGNDGLMPGISFNNPKSPELLFYLFSAYNPMDNKDDYIILDFFSGSATTAQSVLELNANDGKSRKFILVQIPEPAHDAEYKTICDIGEDRIRRAAKKIKEETNADIDYGFRVYKVDSSNMNDVYYKPNDISQGQLDMFELNIKEDRTTEDILTQVILDLGLTLDLKIEEKNILNNKVYFVDENSLIACFDDKIDINIVDEICKYRPWKVVFKDSSFKYDNDKINLQERFKKLSPDTEINIL